MADEEEDRAENEDWVGARVRRLDEDEARIRERVPGADREEVNRLYKELGDISDERKHLKRMADREARLDACAAGVGELASRMDAMDAELEQARDKGRAAARARKPRSDNPYFVSALRRAWFDAYDEVLEGRADALTDWARNRIETLGSEEIKLRRRLTGESDPHVQSRLREELEKIKEEVQRLGRESRDDETRSDPPTSEAQRRAMWAAASGKSNIGIPKSVGREFSEADPGGKLPEHK